MQPTVLPVKNSNNGHNSGTSLIVGIQCWKPFLKWEISALNPRPRLRTEGRNIPAFEYSLLLSRMCHCKSRTHRAIGGQSAEETFGRKRDERTG
jgi:hypothetical protein